MALPLAIPLLLAALGGGASYLGTRQSTNAANSAASKELARQKKYREEAQKMLAASMSASTPVVGQQQIAEGQAQAAGNYDRLAALPMMPAGGPVQMDQQQRILQDSQQRQSNTARSKLTGYDAWALEQSIKNLRASQELAMKQKQAQDSAALLPYELQAAGSAGAGLQGLGSIVSALGMLYGLGGLAGASGKVANVSGLSGTAGVDWNPSMLAKVGSIA